MLLSEKIYPFYQLFLSLGIGCEKCGCMCFLVFFVSMLVSGFNISETTTLCSSLLVLDRELRGKLPPHPHLPPAIP